MIVRALEDTEEQVLVLRTLLSVGRLRGEQVEEGAAQAAWRNSEETGAGLPWNVQGVPRSEV